MCEKKNKSKSRVVMDRETCDLCKEAHALKECVRFLSLKIKNRRKFASENEICQECLEKKAEHPRQQCTSSHCTQCGEFHNFFGPCP